MVDYLLACSRILCAANSCFLFISSSVSFGGDLLYSFLSFDLLRGEWCLLGDLDLFREDRDLYLLSERDFEW